MAAAAGPAIAQPAAAETGPGKPRIRVLELFAGIGGMRLALSYAGLDVDALAVEVNEIALRAYKRNFGDAGVIARDLRSLSVSWFDQQGCQVWTMSPPCQPYTRQGKVRDAEDARAQPLLHVIHVLENMRSPPEAIVLENVQNFERSESCARLLAALRLRGYDWRSFLLSPRQFGFPNARSRFYLVAKQQRWPFDLVPTPAAQDAGVVCQPWPLLPCLAAARAGVDWTAEGGSPASACEADGGAAGAKEAEFTCSACSRPVPEAFATGAASTGCAYPTPPILQFLDSEDGEATTAEEIGECSSQAPPPWLVPESVMQKESARCFDVLQGGCQHSLCFTKAYGRYVNGTGSVYMMARRLAEPSVDEYTMREFFGSVRYFTPREVARLLGFKLRSVGAPACTGGCLPVCSAHEGALESGGAADADGQAAPRAPPCRCPAFDLPSGPAAADGARELWALLGNSLNPQVVALVCQLCQLADIVPEACSG